MADHDGEAARAILWRIMDERGWRRTDLARRANLSHTTLIRFLGNREKGLPGKRGLGVKAAWQVYRALTEEGVGTRQSHAFLHALSVDLPGEDRGRDAASENRQLPQGRAKGKISEADPSIEDRTAFGVWLASRDSSGRALRTLAPLVARYPRGVLLSSLHGLGSVKRRIAAAVASGSLGMCYINQGMPDQAVEMFEQVAHLLDEDDMPARTLAAFWEPWYAITGRSPTDFRLWCNQQMAVALRVGGNRRDTDEARARLLHVAHEARRGQLDPRGIKGNALRDLAMAEMKLNPTVRAAGQHLDESISLLRDVDAGAMVAISLMKRAQWYKAQKNWAAMERDVLDGFEQPTNPTGVMPVNIITTAAEVYTSIDPALAEQLARMALARAIGSEYEGQRQRAEIVLRTIGAELPESESMTQAPEEHHLAR